VRLQRRPSFISGRSCCSHPLAACRGTKLVPPPPLPGACSVWSGRIYVAIVARRMRTQQGYSPQFEDWLFPVLLPFAGCAMLIGSVYAARTNVGWSLFAVAATALLLLFVGIHNAWDAVTYHVLISRSGQRRSERRDGTS
jgi:hypothetical protein